jgi:hypothetical protein
VRVNAERLTAGSARAQAVTPLSAVIYRPQPSALAVVVRTAVDMAVREMG